ncbi:MAG TPA: exodeoxyribonuclease VII large subunit [Solirubrobacterales bacterium]|nr:exodeoxyribonuclease VII large subunit [Solirubrobacterales bacterium]
MEEKLVVGEVSTGLPGPFAVGRYAKQLRGWLRQRAKVELIGEVTGVRHSAKQAYFELRDPEGAVPCTMWADDLAKANIPEGGLRDGVEVVIGGGLDYWPGSGTSSPGFSFRATHVRLAGEGDLIARLEALRKQLRSEGLFELQKQLHRPQLPKAIGVVTAETGAARRDLLAGLQRRGWGGSVIWGFAPVQDRHAAPAIGRAVQDLAARPEVEAIVVTRGGGSLADLWAFCDETLCRTVAMLRVPVVSAVGHERDKTLIDDVAAVACSTPTHAAEAAVPLDCLAARESLERCAVSLRRAGEGAIGTRSRHLGALARGPARALQRERTSLNQKIREIRAAAERGLADRVASQTRKGTVVLERARKRAIGADMEKRRAALRRAEVALRAHEPERTLERGYALVEGPGEEPLTSAAAAAAAGEVRLRFADGRVGARTHGTSDGDDGRER